MTLKWKWWKGLPILLFLALGAVWFWLAVSPAHWLRQVDFGAVKLDGRPIDAEILLGNPTGEAEAIVLVRLKDGHDYFLDFGTEKWRQASPSEYVRLFGGVWSFRSLRKGQDREREQLPFRTLNEFRIPTQDGQEVSVQF